MFSTNRTRKGILSLCLAATALVGTSALRDAPAHAKEVGEARSTESEFEYRVKAEVLERLTRFIEWPQLHPSGTFVIGVVGRNPFGGSLERIARERGFKGLRTVVRELGSANGAEGCHLVFVSREGLPHLEELLGRTRGRPVLTVGDTPGLAQRGVIINLLTERHHLHFEVNPSQAKASGLKISSKLLRLGRVVEGTR